MTQASYKYPDGSEYKGEWNRDGQRHGFGMLILTDGTKYIGEWVNGLCHGLGIMVFSDGSKYEGEFHCGTYNNLGVFTRCDQMKYEGEFKEGKVIGRGLMTFTDGTHGLPRNEGNLRSKEILLYLCTIKNKLTKYLLCLCI